MKYWLFVGFLLITFFFCLDAVANNVNRQLCLDAATVLDLQVSEDNVRFSVLNENCFFKLSGLAAVTESAKQGIETAIGETRLAVSKAADALYKNTVCLRFKLEYYIDAAGEFLRNQGDHGED